MNLQIIKSAAQAIGDYDKPLWKESEPKPDYWELFCWLQSFGDRKYGMLKEELFDTIDKKIAYLQGVFEGSEGRNIIKGEDYLIFANSHNKVERCKEWINEVGDCMRQKGFEESNDNLGFLEHGVISHLVEYYCPNSHTIRIHPKVIKFIKNYQPKI